MARAVDEAHVAHQLEAAGAGRSQARETVVLRRTARYEACRPRTFRIVTFVDFRISVTCGIGYFEFIVKKGEGGVNLFAGMVIVN